MKGRLEAAIEALMAEGHRAVKLSESSKWSEPQVDINVLHNGIWVLDFYSYCLGIEPPYGRHHEATAKSVDELVGKMWEMVALARAENNSMEKEANEGRQPAEV